MDIYLGLEERPEERSAIHGGWRTLPIARCGRVDFGPKIWIFPVLGPFVVIIYFCIDGMSGYSVLILDAELTIYTNIYIQFHILDKKRVPPRPVYLK